MDNGINYSDFFDLDYGVPNIYANNATDYTDFKKEIEDNLKELLGDDIIDVEMTTQDTIAKLCYVCLGKGTLPSKRGTTLLCNGCCGRQYVIKTLNNSFNSLYIKVIKKNPIENIEFSIPLNG